MEKLAMYHKLVSCLHRKQLSKVMDKSTQTGTHTNNAHDKHTIHLNTDKTKVTTHILIRIHVNSIFKKKLELNKKKCFDRWMKC